MKRWPSSCHPVPVTPPLGTLLLINAPSPGQAAPAHAYPLCATCHCQRPRRPNSGSTVMPVGAKTPNLSVNHLPFVAKNLLSPPIVTRFPQNPSSDTPARRHFPLALTLPPSVPYYPTPPGQSHFDLWLFGPALPATVIPAKAGIQCLKPAVSQPLSSSCGFWTPASAYGGHLRLAPECRVCKFQVRLLCHHPKPNPPPRPATTVPMPTPQHREPPSPNPPTCPPIPLKPPPKPCPRPPFSPTTRSIPYWN